MPANLKATKNTRTGNRSKRNFIWRYYGENRGRCEMGVPRTLRMLVLMAATWLATPAFAQQQPPPPAQDKATPDRVVEEIGNAVRGFFRSIFGQQEGEIPAPAPAAPQAQPAPS